MLSTAGYASYRLTAVDLSRASLAFAARKIEELKLPDIRLLHGDILDLDALPESFDVIEATGVLHHMRDPLQGWRVLAKTLRPGGVMSVALYSSTARRGIMALRAWAAAKGFAPTHDGIVAFRAAVLAILRDPHHPDRAVIDAAGLATSHDFYAVSTCRDLFFHPQEAEFTIPDIARMIAALGLVFRGFTFPSPAFLNAYRSRFPADPQGLALANWDRFERENPALFIRMYAFTVQKPL
jgi:SAM-dependent methyltransferase